jgi:Holliday junction resolvase RusA-like endonuclease
VKATLGELARCASEKVAVGRAAPTTLRFTIPGEPVGKERARVFRKVNPNGTVITRAVTPEKTRAYEEKVRTIAQIAVNQSRWAWSTKDRFSMVIKVYRTHWDAGADASNVLKSIEDACNGVTYRDDRYVRGVGIALQPPDPDNPRVEVEIHRYLVTHSQPKKVVVNAEAECDAIIGTSPSVPALTVSEARRLLR